VRISVIYYSRTGTVHGLACALAEGARSAGAEVRLRRVSDLYPIEPVDSPHEAPARAVRHVPLATLDDVEWAHAIAFGTPSFFGNVAAPLKYFIECGNSLWREGKLVDKVVTAFTAATHANSGNESTLLALYQSMYHWGALIVPPGYSGPEVNQATGNPYGCARFKGYLRPDQDSVFAAARHQGRRAARIAALVHSAPRSESVHCGQEVEAVEEPTP
jgi:NAD(P)H dehydrogenase (quinone)